VVLRAVETSAFAGDSGLTTLELAEPRSTAASAEGHCLALVVIWWQGEPDRLGEVILPMENAAWFGRGVDDASAARLSLVRQRPGRNEPAPASVDPFLSRRHLRVTALGETLGLECAGKQPVLVDGVERREAEVGPLGIVEIRGVCSFVCVERPARLDAGSSGHEFGRADAHGIVGESAAAWALRRRIDFVAGRAAHVLVTGASGTGKELVARAVHARSARGQHALVARNAATLPPSLIDAELFGNAAHYPNAGMSERPGLIGQAHRSTLFLDEIGELPAEQHAHLLRVLDAGEYQRLGDARPRTADVRFIAATNREVTSLKADLAARLALRVDVPGLDERPEDVPLIARELLRRMTYRDPELQARFAARQAGGAAGPRLSAELAALLTLHCYSAHVRELEGLLWRSLQTSDTAVLEVTHEVRALLRPRAPDHTAARAAGEVSREELRAALVRHQGIKERVWRELGLSSRHALLRLMKKLGET
jgi:two-component system nitrogen regulation response regulator GlnG/two-component system response regulator HydG